MDQKYERIPIFRCRRKPECPEKTYTKTGMESANQIYIQPLASCIGERKVFEPKPTRLATGVVYHPDSEQNRPYKFPWPCRELNRWPTAPQARTLPVCHTTTHLYKKRYISMLAVHNWQKWKSRFLTCPCHKIYRKEVGLKSSKYTLKITIFVNMWNFG